MASQGARRARVAAWEVMVAAKVEGAARAVVASSPPMVSEAAATAATAA